MGNFGTAFGKGVEAALQLFKKGKVSPKALAESAEELRKALEVAVKVAKK